MVPPNVWHSWDQNTNWMHRISAAQVNLCVPVSVSEIVVYVCGCVFVDRCYASNFVELCNRIQMKYLNASLRIFSHAYISIYWLVYFYNYYHFCLLARERKRSLDSIFIFHLPFRLHSAIRSSHSASVFCSRSPTLLDCVLIFVLFFCGLL